jgi:hypothetical protein
MCICVCLESTQHEATALDASIVEGADDK